jgi:hypothetical protein
MAYREKGWPVEARFDLPLGFSLRADETFAYLYHKRDGLVAVFGRCSCPEFIAAEAAKYARTQVTIGA